MIRPTAVLLASLAVLLAACGTTSPSPALTDPKAIVTAALDSTAVAQSAHFDIRVDGTAKVALPGSPVATPVKLDGTTASADVDFEEPAAHVTFAVPAVLNFSGEVIAVDGKAYVKSTLTGPQFRESAASGVTDPGAVGGMIEGLGALLENESVELTKGADTSCGASTCYTVTTELTAEDLGGATGAATGLPIDLTGATLDLTILVEQDEPNHLAGLEGVVTLPDGTALTIEVTASKWNVPVSIAPPPPDQIQPAT